MSAGVLSSWFFCLKGVLSGARRMNGGRNARGCGAER